MAHFTGGTIEIVYPYHDPNEGREIWNKNFKYVNDSIEFSITGSTSGKTIVQGSDNITVLGSGATVPPIYSVYLNDDIVINSLSATSISADTYYVGSSSLEQYLTGSSVFVSGSTGNYSIKANNDSGIDATGNYSYAEGDDTLASGARSHAEGYLSTASGGVAHAQGYQTTASGNNGSHAEGNGTISSGQSAHAEGVLTVAGANGSHAEGTFSKALGSASHAEGNATSATTLASHSEGQQTLASGQYSHAEGYQTTAIGTSSHAEGANTTASGNESHAEGNGTTASGINSHAEGSNNTASASNSHAEGTGTLASGATAHAEGTGTVAGGNYSHAGGFGSSATGTTSFVHSTNSFAYGDRSVVLGGQNITGATDDTVYVPNLNIDTTPLNDDALTQLLVRDTDGTVKYRDVTSILTANNGLTKIGDNITLGGALTGDTYIGIDGNTLGLTGGSISMDDGFGINIGTNIIDAGDSFFGAGKNYIQMRTKADYTEPWFFMNEDSGLSVGKFFQWNLGTQTADIGMSLYKVGANHTQTNNNHIAFYDNSGSYTIANNYVRNSVLGFIAAEGSATASVEGSVAIASSAVTMNENYTLYTDKLNLVDAPVNDNTLTQILARDGSTGKVNYRDVISIITGATTASTQTLAQVLVEGNETGANDILIDSGQVLSGNGTTNVINLNVGGAIEIDTSSGGYQAGVYANGNYAALYGNNWGPGFDVNKDIASDTDVLRMYTSNNGPSIAISEDTSAINIQGRNGLQISNTTSSNSLISDPVTPGVSAITSILTSVNSEIRELTKYSSIVGGSGHTINPGITSSVIIGGTSITAAESNAVYMPRMIGTRTDEAALNLPVMDNAFSSTTQGDVWITTGATNTFINVFVGGVVKSVELT